MGRGRRDAVQEDADSLPGDTSYQGKVLSWLSSDNGSCYAESLSNVQQLDGTTEVTKRKRSDDGSEVCRKHARESQSDCRKHAREGHPDSSVNSSADSSEAEKYKQVVFAAGMNDGPYLGHVIFDCDANEVYELKPRKYDDKLDVCAILSDEDKKAATLTTEEKEKMKSHGATVQVIMDRWMMKKGRDGFEGMMKKGRDGFEGKSAQLSYLVPWDHLPNVDFVRPHTGLYHAFRDDTEYPATGTEDDKKAWVNKVLREATPGIWKLDGMVQVKKGSNSAAGVLIVEHKGDAGKADLNAKSLYSAISLLSAIDLAGLLFVEPNGTYVLLAHRNREKKTIDCRFRWYNLWEIEEAENASLLLGSLVKFGQAKLANV